MQTGVIRRRDDSCVLDRWRADASSIVVDTADPALWNASDQILNTPRHIPVHGAERHEFATHGDTRIEAPSTITYLALFTLELGQRGFVLEPDDGERLAWTDRLLSLLPSDLGEARPRHYCAMAKWSRRFKRQAFSSCPGAKGLSLP